MMISEAGEAFSWILDRFETVLRNDTEASVIFVRLVLILVTVGQTNSLTGQISSSLSRRHAWLNTGLFVHLSLSIAVESFFNLLNIAAVSGVDEVLADLGAEEGKADLVQHKQDDYGDVEWLIILHNHHDQSQGVVKPNCCCVHGGLEL